MRLMSDKEQMRDEIFLTVAGRDRSGDLGRDICAAAKALDDPGLQKSFDDGAVITALGSAENENDFIERHLEVFGQRTQLDFGKCRLPATSGIAGRIIGVVRKFVWRLLRFAFEWMVFRQNVVNEQQAIALEHEVSLRKRENEELLKRVEYLESKIGLNEEVGS